ncbi:hypothetical protein [Caproiciproducens sp. CPB-2]|uniref:hypothetical protein n=1 Tax=Caproiciproducens sp. CPB-2 TaxID=3030017 RepID=UPI0023DB32E5|nr:hypothetical protein [Caproiciproducens sp. CPB-2]MDF1494571.1 hypothetical protein [Caproiciproducens sp. CPB-2]
MGIGNIKVVLESVTAVVFVIENRNAFCPFVHPSAKLLVPLFNFKDGGGVGALGVNQDLLVKAAFVVPAGRMQERRPRGGGIRYGLYGRFI